MSSATEMKYSRQATGKQELGLVCGAWVPRAGSVTDSPSAFVLVGRYDVNSERAIDVREYNFDSDTLSDTIHAIETEDGRPLQLAVHPSGDGFLCSVSDSCKFYEINPKGPWKLKVSERRLPLLQGKQIQNCICFSSDGSFLATGGCHLRLYTWPACHLLLDERHARPIQDIDISMDSAYVASIAEDGACRVWNITKGECIAQLRREKLDEKFGYCRFSRDGTQAFLFASFTKKGSFLGGDGYIGVWNMVGWSMIGSKKFDSNPISSLRDGKSLCSGSTGGDMAVISVRKMEVTQVVRTVRLYPITGLEFSKHGRSLLSLGADTNARVAQLEMSERKDSQLYLVLLGMIALSGLLFFAIFESSLSDDFWKFPMGRAQPALPSPETTWGYPSY